MKNAGPSNKPGQSQTKLENKYSSAFIERKPGYDLNEYLRNVQKTGEELAEKRPHVYVQQK